MTASVCEPRAEIYATLCEAASAACDAGTSEPSPAASETSTAGTTNRRTSPRPTVVLADIVAVLSADAYRAWHDANTLSNPPDTEGKKITSRSAECRRAPAFRERGRLTAGRPAAAAVRGAWAARHLRRRRRAAACSPRARRVPAPTERPSAAPPASPGNGRRRSQEH